MWNAFIVIEHAFSTNIGLPFCTTIFMLLNATLSVAMVITLPLSAVVRRGFHLGSCVITYVLL